MIPSGGGATRDKITVRIRNMRRSSDRDTPPTRAKRARSSLGRGGGGGAYDDSSDERVTPERHSRRRISRARSPLSPPPPTRNSGGGSRYLSPHRDDAYNVRSSDHAAASHHHRASYAPYKVLCVSALHPKAPDDLVKDTLYREFKKYGDLSIRLAHDLDERVAYLCFRSAEDARDAKHSKPRVIVYDKMAIVEAVYETMARPTSSDLYARAPRPRSLTPPLDHYDHRQHHYYAPTRSPDRLRGYDRAYGPPPPHSVHPHHHHYRREAVPLPPPPHHDPYLGRPPPMHHGHHAPLPPPHHHHMGPAPPGPLHHHPYGVPPVAPRHMLPPHRQPMPQAPYDAGGKLENKKDKFPNYLHHVQPEDDPLATRTLFAGNLEINITEEELRRIFGRYGTVEDIDIKRPPPGTGNAFAFVRYQTLDMAHRAKVELSGQYIGKFQCKIGYGKATPTMRIWVGGLGPWTSVPQLEREFDRFGAIKKIDYAKGDNQAFILYDSIDAAQAAVKEMRGFPLGGPERRLRTDFSDASPPLIGYRPTKTGDYADGAYTDYGGDLDGDYGRSYRGRVYSSSGSRGGGGRYPDGDIENNSGDWNGRRMGSGSGPPGNNNYGERRRSPGVVAGAGGRNPAGGGDHAKSRSRSPPSNNNSNHNRHHSPANSGDSGDTVGIRRAGLLASSRTLPEVARKCTTIWQGALILKNSLFPAKFHLMDGDTDIVDGLMKDEDGRRELRITQRLRLDQPKLEDVQRRISGASSHAIFLGLAGSTAAVQNDDVNVQTRPLRNLVSYLKQKEAAGVISLLNKETEATGVLYSFPPCQFSADLLKRTCPNLSEEALKDDHLIIVVVRGSTA